MQTLAPIALFVYNRPDHTERTLKFLRQNELAAESRLFIFSDGARTEKDESKVSEVRTLLRTIDGFKSIKIIESLKNKGLAQSVISGANEILQQYQKIIVLEDDLLTSTDFLSFMNEALDRYKEQTAIFSVTGYSYPLAPLKNYLYSAYFSHRGSSWSWATWLDRWQTIDWEIKDDFINNKMQQQAFNKTCGPDLSNMLIKQLNGKIDSWAIRFAYNAFIQGKLHVLAAKNKVKNIGHDNTGTHSPKTTKYDMPLVTENRYVFPEVTAPEDSLKRAMIKFHTKNFVIRLIRMIIPLKK
jgi:hypothetical protein